MTVSPRFKDSGMPDIRSLSERLSTGLLFILMVPLPANQPFRAKLGSFHHSHTHMGCVPLTTMQGASQSTLALPSADLWLMWLLVCVVISA